VDIATGYVLRNTTIRLRNGRIQEVLSGGGAGPAAGYESVSALGKFAMPALWDMHTHGLKISPQLHHTLFIRNFYPGYKLS